MSKNGFIPLSKSVIKKNISDNRYGNLFSIIAFKPKNPGGDFELSFEAKRVKTNTKDKFIEIGINIPTDKNSFHSDILKANYDKKIFGKLVHKFRIRKENNVVTIFQNNKQIKQLEMFNPSVAEQVMLLGNNIGVYNIVAKNIPSKHSKNFYDKKLSKLDAKINLSVKFLNDYKKAVNLGLLASEYYDIRTNIDYTSCSVSEYERVQKFVKSNPEFETSAHLTNIIKAGNSFLLVDQILASDLSAREKSTKIFWVKSYSPQMDLYKEKAQKGLYSEIMIPVIQKCDSIKSLKTSQSSRISNLIYYMVSMYGSEREAGGDELVLKLIGELITDKTQKVIKSNMKLASKIKALDTFLNSLQNGATLAEEHAMCKETLKALCQKSIKSSVNMYYKTRKKTEPLVTHVEVRDETSIGDAMFGQTNYVAYTTTTGGNTYNEITGYEIKGTIKNLTNETLVVKARSDGSLNSSGNSLVDFGRLFTAVITNQGNFHWEEKEYTIKPWGSVAYKLSGDCTKFIEMSVVFKVIEVGDTWVGY